MTCPSFSVAVTLAVIFQVLLFPGIGNATEVFRCKARGGQILYSNEPCEKQGAVQAGVVDTTPNIVGGITSIPVGPPIGSMAGPSDRPATTAGQIPFVNGYIGKKPVRFMVDTGASEVAIPYKRAVELGIPVFAGERAESTTASGRVGVYRIRLASITVGNVTVRNVPAHVSLNDGGSQHILLGMSFLRHVRLIVEGGRVSIRPL